VAVRAEAAVICRMRAKKRRCVAAGAHRASRRSWFESRKYRICLPCLLDPWPRGNDFHCLGGDKACCVPNSVRVPKYAK
jgi:hypothetical protein